MALNVSPPVLSYNQIKKTAEDFLDKYYPQLTLPIPIEEIVELKLKIKLSTEINLKSEHGIDGFIHSSFEEITVDDYVFNKYEQRTRFTIAHELAHKILHSKIYERFKIKTIDEYVKFQNIITPDDQKWLEIQANIFAACVLVPAKKLKEELFLATKGINVKNTIQADYSIPFLQNLPHKFKVSPIVIYRRIQKEKLLSE